MASALHVAAHKGPETLHTSRTQTPLIRPRTGTKLRAGSTAGADQGESVTGHNGSVIATKMGK